MSYRRNAIEMNWTAIIGDRTFRFERYENHREVITYVYESNFSEHDNELHESLMHQFIWQKTTGN